MENKIILLLAIEMVGIGYVSEIEQVSIKKNTFGFGQFQPRNQTPTTKISLVAD